MSKGNVGYEVFVGHDRSYEIHAPTRRAAVVQAALHEYFNLLAKHPGVLVPGTEIVNASVRYKVVRI